MTDKTDNIYEPPKANLDLDTTEGSSELAGRWQRLGAAIIDGLTVMVVTIPAMFLTGGFKGITSGDSPSIFYTLIMGLLGIAVFVGINFKFLKENGQTIGKKVLDIKITKLDKTSVPEMNQLVKRYGLYLLAGQVPIIGGVLSMVNAAFIFGKEKRCVHDLVGETVVVRK